MVSQQLFWGVKQVIAVFLPLLHIHCHSLADANLISHLPMIMASKSGLSP